ncbi:hypothetical protein [Flavobacterium sp. FlaQc-47]|uniref:hypothetical protein n=1 Tax=Flavobacterium sp. FlaQc-47 TaxID=3374180 RepID=UPI0037578054
MKKITIKAFLFIFCLFTLLSCSDEELLGKENLAAPVKLEIKGLILTDTLQFVLDGKVVGEGIGGAIRISDRLYQPGQKIQVNKKADGKQIDEILIEKSPFKQVKKIFYDGITFSDKIELTPVVNTNNMGVRMRFTSSSKFFYGGPVDVEFMIQEIDMNTFEFSYVKANIMFKNVTGSFGEFMELPPLISDDVTIRQYVIVVHKSGTNEHPYKDGVEYGGYPDPDVVFGNLENFNAGDSVLLSVKDGFSGETFLSAYYIEDLSTPFK